jgi:cytochrome c biogenesis protein CcdA/thiol-disulfide isomerase/thioredoxin
MLLFLLAYLGGALTIVSPCILPVLPFVFARAEKGFLRSGLPLLVGMALTFAAVASLAAVGGGWAVRANTYGRDVALAIMALFGLTLLFPALADRLTRPLVALGSRLSEQADGAERAGSSIGPSFLLGIATGLLWAPCAGPILGVILTGAALEGASVGTSLLLLAYALGAATSLALALVIGGRVFAAMKRSLGAGEWIRRGLGVAVLAGVVAIGFGLDTGFLSKLSLASTSGLEQALVDRAPINRGADKGLMVNGRLDSLSGADAWINSPPLTAQSLRGKVVVVDFWTYSCINCLRSLPYVEAWAEKYKDQGLVVIGVHTPEFAFEHDVGNVRKAVADLHITYPVAVDDHHVIWRAFDNQYWPAHYFIDATGRVRAHHFGEGDYAQSEKTIQMLLAEAGRTAVPGGVVAVAGQGAEAASNQALVGSPETYIGYAQAEGFASPGDQVDDQAHTYAAPANLQLNDWALVGTWTVGLQQATLNAAGGAIAYRFHARDLHLVLGPAVAGRRVRFRVLIDGKPAGADHGVDTDAQGLGVVNGQRLHQLVRMQGAPADHTFEIQFLDPGVQAFAFTFG